MSMPGDITSGSGNSWYGTNLTAFVQNGTIAESRVDDMAERIIAGWYFLGQDNNYPDGELISVQGIIIRDTHANAWSNLQ